MKEANVNAGITAIGLRPLTGKTVLVTRTVDRGEDFSQLLKERGADVVIFPTIEIVPPKSWQDCDRAIAKIGDYDSIVFTSGNAVKAFVNRLDAQKEKPSRNILKKTLYVVGIKTGDALAAEGMIPILLPGVANAAQLAEALLQLLSRPRRILFPKGNLAGDELTTALRNAGIQVDEVVVYNTVTPHEADTRSIEEKLRSGVINILTFFSASSVKYFVEMFPPELITTKTIAVVGTNTAAAVREAGLHVHIAASRPTSEDLVDAIVKYYNE